MATINIRSDVKDPFYRYKMERLQSKIEGKGNGIKTVIVNLSSVAQSLARPGSYVIKYFGFELGAQTNSNPADDRWIINGSHEASKLQEYLNGFINKFVLCKKCKNPETDVVIKDGRILLDCKACGERSDVDLRLKLSGFILKNAPKKGKKDKVDRKAARKAKLNGGNGDTEENGHANGDDSNSENGSNENGDALEADSDDEMLKAAQELDSSPAVVKEDEWTVDMSPEAVRARQQQLPDDFKQKLVLGGGEDDDEDGDGAGGNSSYDQLGNWVISEGESKGGLANVDDVEIYLKAKELGIETKHRTVLVLVQTMFDGDIVKQIPKRASMLKKMVTTDKHQRALLGGVERFIGLRAEGKSEKEQAEIYKLTNGILMKLYDDDILSEEAITKWGTKSSRKYVDLAVSKKVRKSAETFLKWLEEAEDESDDDDSE